MTVSESPEVLAAGLQWRDLDEVRALLDKLPVGMLIAHDPECRRITGNAIANRLMRIESEGNVSMTPAGAVNVAGYRAFRGGEELPVEELPLRRAIAGKPVENLPYQLRFPDGSSMELLVSAAPLRDESGRIRGAVATLLDVTEQKQAETALRESENRSRGAADRLALALRAARMGDWMWDAGTDMVTFSERAAEIFGVNAGPHLTWTRLREMLHPDDRQRAADAVEKSLREREDYDIEYRILSGHGIERWVMARGRGVYSGRGEPVGMIGVVQDISERKALESQLLGRTQTLEAMLATSTVISGELDVGKVVQKVTDTATRITGAQFGAFFYNVIDMQGGSYMLYSLSGVDRSHFASFPMPRATALFGPTFRGEGVIRSPDIRRDARYGKSAPYHGMPPGHLPVVSYLAVPVVSRSGEVLGGLFFGHGHPDVFTEEHAQAVQGLAAQAAVAIDNSRLHDRARHSLEVAENASRMKDEFLATVSHELRTPLSSMVGWVHMLRSGRLGPADQQRALETLERNMKAQQQIIGDILDVSRIITGKLRIELQPIEVVAAIEAAIETLRPLMESKQITIAKAFESAVIVLGDANRLQQVVWNLVANAVKYTPRGGRVQVSLTRKDSQVELRVADNGEGIDPAFLPHVFDRFRQADSSTTRTHGGIGLGLAIVRHLVELHGGSVEARSDGPNKGSEFYVRLPIAASASPPGKGTEAPARVLQPRAADAAKPASFDLRGLKLLVLDDEPDTRSMLAAVLTHAGAAVTSAASAEEALSLLEQARPDVIVSDIGMPREDGYGFMRRLRARGDAALTATPAIALTAYARPEDRLRCLAAGFKAHLAKPADPEELIGLVASLAGRTGR